MYDLHTPGSQNAGKLKRGAQLRGTFQRQGNQLDIHWKIRFQFSGDLRRTDQMQAESEPVQSMKQGEHVLFRATASRGVREEQDRDRLVCHRAMASSLT